MFGDIGQVRFTDAAQNRWANKVAQQLRQVSRLADGANAKASSALSAAQNISLDELQRFGQVEAPTAVTNFRALDGYSSVIIQWDLPTYAGHAFTRLYRSPTNAFGDAVKLADVGVAIYSDPLPEDTGYYYWARHININGDQGPINAIDGTYAKTAITYAGALDDVLEDVLASLNLWQTDILDAMAILDNRTLQLALNTDGAISQLINQVSVTEQNLDAAYNQTVTAVANEVGAAVTKVEQLSANVYTLDDNGNPVLDENGEPVFSGAFIDNVDAVLAGKDGELMAAIGQTIGVTRGDTTYTLSEIMSLSLDSQDTFTAQWGIKASVNDLQHGVGFVINTDEFGQPYTAFHVAADLFSVHNPQTTETVHPFIIDDKGRTLIKTALIDEAVISSLVAQTIVTDELFAGKQIASPFIKGGSLEIGPYFNVSTAGAVVSRNIVIEDVVGNTVLASIPGAGTFIDGAYITNLLVDTLSIANNAVTVPLAIETSEMNGTSFTLLDLAWDSEQPGVLQFNLAMEILRDGDVSGAYDNATVTVQVYDDGSLVKTFTHKNLDIDANGGDLGRKIWPLLGSYPCSTRNARIRVSVVSNTPGQAVFATLRGYVLSAKK